MALDMNYDEDMPFALDNDTDEEPLKEETSQRPPPAKDPLVDVIEKVTDENEDILRILVASDIHVGYGENKPNLYLDSINTFEEVLKIAVEKKVDMVLLGGDLFHENNPSRDMQHRVIQLLRQYCFNDKEVALEFVSDASVNFEHSHFDRVNYEDANINVGLPIFTIHGNHDDTAGKGLTILDVLHEAGLVNLFGKFSDIDQFDVSPILLRKGSTRVALFGIGSQRDDRLCRAFADCQYVASSDAAGDGFYILQPGSTIATSLTKEEALQKNVFLIKVKGRKFQCKPIPLQTVRQMIVDEIVLDSLPKGVRLPANGLRPSGGGFVLDEMIIDDKISEMIRDADKDRASKQPRLPLIRLKVTYAGPWATMQPVNARQIGEKFDGQVANPAEVVVTKRVTDKKKKKGGISVDEERGDIINAACLDQVISEHFNKLPWEERLTVFTHPVIGKALTVFDDDERTTSAKAVQEFRGALEVVRDSMLSKMKQMPAPEIEFDKHGNVKSDDFEMMVRSDLNMLKRQTYGVQDMALTRGNEMQEGDV